MKASQFAHVCQDGHPLIGHNDSEHEQCPLCRALEDVRRLEEILDSIDEAAD